MEFRHLQYFITLAEELHFRRAAEKLFIAQPALSRQIKDLEERLGVTLFKRDKRNVSLTSAGKFLQQEAYPLLKKVAEIESSITNKRLTTSGFLRIGCIGSAMAEIVPQLISQLSQEWPQVETHVIEDTTQNLLYMLIDGQIDVLFGRPHQQLANIASEVIFTDTSIVAVARANRWGIDTASKVEDLRGVPFILFPRSAGTFFRDQIVRTCAKYDFFPEIRHESLNSFSLLKLVEKGLGISVLPKSITESYQLDIVYLEMTELVMPLDLVLSYRRDQKTEVVQDLLEKVKILTAKKD